MTAGPEWQMYRVKERKSWTGHETTTARLIGLRPFTIRQDLHPWCLKLAKQSLPVPGHWASKPRALAGSEVSGWPPQAVNHELVRWFLCACSACYGSVNAPTRAVTLRSTTRSVIIAPGSRLTRGCCACWCHCVVLAALQLRSDV